MISRTTLLCSQDMPSSVHHHCFSVPLLLSALLPLCHHAQVQSAGHVQFTFSLCSGHFQIPLAVLSFIATIIPLPPYHRVVMSSVYTVARDSGKQTIRCLITSSEDIVQRQGGRLSGLKWNHMGQKSGYLQAHSLGGWRGWRNRSLRPACIS